MKVFKTRVLAALVTICMLFSLLPISALAAEEATETAGSEGYDLSLELKGTGVTWYARDEEGAEIDEENFAIPLTEVEVDTDGDVPTIKLTTTLYVKADPGYAFEELTDLVITGEGEESDEPSGTFDMQVTDDAEYCDLKVTLIFDGYAIEGKSASITLTIDADPVYEFSLDLKGTGVTWYAKDEAGAEIGDEGYAIPSTSIEVEGDEGDVPVLTVTTTLYVKADPGYAFEELTDLVITGEGEEEEDPSRAFDMQITDDAEYCDLKVTLKFDGYVIEGTAASITLTIDADPTYFTLMAGGTKLDIDTFSTMSYAEAEAIVCVVEYNAEGATVPVLASVEDPADGVVIGYPVVDGVPAYDEESHTGVNAFVDVTPENTIDNPVYVAVKYIPNKEGVTEAKPYDEYFKIALYMAPAAPEISSVSVSPTNDKLEVDGKAQSPAAYKINDYNYFKLRDIAALLNGTGKQFSVGYDSSTNTVTLTSGQPYEVTDSDLAALPAESRQATASTNVIYINGASAQLTAYNIDGYNYFKLRDLASALDFYVDWTAERGMFLESDKPYSA